MIGGRLSPSSTDASPLMAIGDHDPGAYQCLRQARWPARGRTVWLWQTIRKDPIVYDAAAIGTLLIGLGYIQAGSKQDQARAGQRESTAWNPRVRLAFARGLRTVAARLQPTEAKAAGH